MKKRGEEFGQPMADAGNLQNKVVKEATGGFFRKGKHITEQKRNKIVFIFYTIN